MTRFRARGDCYETLGLFTVGRDEIDHENFNIQRIRAGDTQSVSELGRELSLRMLDDPIVPAEPTVPVFINESRGLDVSDFSPEDYSPVRRSVYNYPTRRARVL